VKGELVQLGEDEYERARTAGVFNGRLPARFPAAVLFAEDDQDVVDGVRLARRNGWRVAVRSGGHSWAAWSVRDDALLIDLGRMREMVLDPGSGVVRVRPAIRGGDELDPYLEEHDRFFGGGHCPTVGLGGFLLQGGQGWNARGWGWAAESIEALDVVTADGTPVRVSEREYPDLFWAARGAGPGFPGVVTRFHLRTRPRFRHAAHSVYLYPMECFDEVMTWQQKTHGSVSADVELVTVGMAPPPGVSHPGPVLAVTGLALVSSAEEAREALAPLESCPVLDRAIVRDFARPTTLAEQRAEQVRMNPEGHRYAVDNAWIDAPPERAVPALRNAFATLPTPGSFTIWFSMAPLRELPDMAFGLQSEIYCASYVVWTEESDDARCRAWLADRMTELEPVTAGQYLGDSDFTTRGVRFTSDANWTRLQAIRSRWDPDDLFTGYLTSATTPLNHNHWRRPPPGK
jgi:FAD/FMN-containing dehydrogenase